MAQYIGYDWAWTINAPSDLDEKHQKRFLVDSIAQITAALTPEVAYICYKGERVTNGHLQGFVQFTVQVTRNQVKHILGKTAHVEKITKPPLANKRYVEKAESQWAIPFAEHGEFIEEWRGLAKTGVSTKRSPCPPHEFVPCWLAQAPSNTMHCMRCNLILTDDFMAK